MPPKHSRILQIARPHRWVHILNCDGAGADSDSRADADSKADAATIDVVVAADALDEDF